MKDSEPQIYSPVNCSRAKSANRLAAGDISFFSGTAFPSYEFSHNTYRDSVRDRPELPVSFFEFIAYGYILRTLTFRSLRPGDIKVMAVAFALWYNISARL